MSEFVTRFRKLFRNLEIAFSVGVPIKDKKDKFGYPTKRTSLGWDEPLTDEYVMEHFRGNIQIGVYPLFDKDKVVWAAMDFDGVDGDENAIDKAIEQSRVFEKNEIISYVEISRSGKGAHVWVFFDEPLEARIVRGVLHEHLIDANTYDRMFPNQDSAKDGYGNLIALPYNGAGYKEGKSTFINPNTREKISPTDFLNSVLPNKASIFKNLFGDIKPSVNSTQSSPVNRIRKESLSGAIKVLTFCNWMKSARARMYQQNQEPEFYALCCQFAQLERGESLAYEFGRLHPYSDERIAEKFHQAVRVNKPHTCKVLREEYGYECTCDLDFGVDHCYELASKSFTELMAARKGEMIGWSDLVPKIITKTKKLYKEGGNFGYPYGYDRLDDMTSLRKGELVVIGARPGIGKTSILTDLSAGLATKGIPCYWGSMEMSAEQLGIKHLGNLTGVDARNIMEANLDREDWKKLLVYQKNNPDLPIYIDDQTRDIDKMLDTFAEKIHEHGKGVILLDYVEMFKTLPGESMHQLTSRVSLESKGMAKVLDVPVVLLSNFNRKAEEEQLEGSQPADGWLRNSGLLEQTADVILYVLGNKGRGIVKRSIHIQKERFTGMAGEQCVLWFDQPHSKFYTTPPNQTSEGRIVIERNTESNLDLL